MIRFPFFTKRLTPIQKAERASSLAVPTQHIGLVRAKKRRATNAGLLSKLSPDAQDRIRAKLAAAEAAR